MIFGKFLQVRHKGQQIRDSVRSRWWQLQQYVAG